MSYPSTCHVDAHLRETLFLILAGENDHSIGKHLDCCDRTVSNQKARLMEKLCGKGDTNEILIYHSAKSSPELCRALAREFAGKYPALAPVVETQRMLRIEFTQENGMRELYVWP